MSKENLSYKLILIGDTGVGKTSLFRKLTKNEFEQKVVSTIGIDRRTLNFNINTKDGEKEIEIVLYDTAGQEKFRAISVNYIRESKGLLLVYDLTNLDSFQSGENWITSIKDSLGDNNDYLIILIGNKLDLVTENPDMRQVEESEAKEFCENKKLLWGGECSAKDFTDEKLNEIFKKYVEEIHKKVGDVFKKEETNLKPTKTKRKKGFC